MTPDVCVGRTPSSAKLWLKPTDKAVLQQLCGDVIIVECPDPSAWFPALRRLRSKACVNQIVVVCAAEVWSDWFRELRETDWSVAFATGARAADGAGLLVAHQGARASAFRCALAQVAAVL
jgi:hypothetical protein